MEKGCFSADNSNWAVVSKDNRLRVFNTATRKERQSYTDRKHLDATYTCLAWGQEANAGLGRIALGSALGSVLVWDLARGVVIQTIALGTNSAPTDLCFSKDLSTLLISSNLSDIVEYSIKTGQLVNSYKGSKKGASALSVSPSSNSFAVGG